MQNSKEAAISYIFGFVSGIILLYMEKHNEFVRKSAAQSVVFSVTSILLSWILNIIPFFGMFLSSCMGFITFLIWIILIIKASKNIYYKLPVIGDIAEKYVLEWFKK